MKRLARIAWLSPFPPQRSGVANYSDVLLQRLKDYADFDLYYDGQPPGSRLLDSFNCYPLEELPSRHQEYDEVIYHLGNNALFHKRIYEHAWHFPGTVVLHDYNLSPFIRDAFRSGLRDLALKNAASRTTSSAQSDAIVDRSRKVIVHHRWVKKQFSRQDHIQVIPHFAQINAQPSAEDIERFRTKWEIDPDSFLIACLGFVNMNKLPRLQIEAIKRLLREGYPVRLIFAGEPAPEIRELVNDALRGSDRKRIVFTGYQTEEDYFASLFAADIVINLRNPSMGEASGTLMHALAAGKPTILSDVNQYKEIPDNVCWKVRHDETEEEVLCEYLKALMCDRNLRKAMASNAAAYARRVFGVNEVVSRWLKVLNLA